MMTHRFHLFPLFVFALILAQSAHAKAAPADKSLGTFGKWRAYVTTKNNQPVCYMAVTQQFPHSKTFKRGISHLMITHRPVEGSTDVVSYTSGFVYKSLVDATVHIGKNNFDLFTDKDTAWARDPHTDHELSSALRSNTSMTITGTPTAKGIKPVTDKLDVTGAADAYRAISKACGLPSDESKKTAPAKAVVKKLEIKKLISKKKSN